MTDPGLPDRVARLEGGLSNLLERYNRDEETTTTARTHLNTRITDLERGLNNAVLKLERLNASMNVLKLFAGAAVTILAGISGRILGVY